MIDPRALVASRTGIKDENLTGDMIGEIYDLADEDLTYSGDVDELIRALRDE